MTTSYEFSGDNPFPDITICPQPFNQWSVEDYPKPYNETYLETCGLTYLEYKDTGKWVGENCSDPNTLSENTFIGFDDLQIPGRVLDNIYFRFRCDEIHSIQSFGVGKMVVPFPSGNWEGSHKILFGFPMSRLPSFLLGDKSYVKIYFVSGFPVHPCCQIVYFGDCYNVTVVWGFPYNHSPYFLDTGV